MSDPNNDQMDNLSQPNQMDPTRPWRGTAPGASFADGGDVGDDGALPRDNTGMQQSINQAIATVDNALSYGRKLHGLPDTGGLPATGGAVPDEQSGEFPQNWRGAGHDYSDFRPKQEIEDRRNDPAYSEPTDFMSQAKDKFDTTMGNLKSGYDDATFSPNQMSRDAGIGDIDVSGDNQQPTAEAAGAIPDQEEDK